jgi:hypothetical protein
MFKPNITARRMASVTEGRVGACVVASRSGECAEIRTSLTVEPTPQGYRA